MVLVDLSRFLAASLSLLLQKENKLHFSINYFTDMICMFTMAWQVHFYPDKLTFGIHLPEGQVEELPSWTLIDWNEKENIVILFSFAADNGGNENDKNQYSDEGSNTNDQCPVHVVVCGDWFGFFLFHRSNSGDLKSYFLRWKGKKIRLLFTTAQDKYQIYNRDRHTYSLILKTNNCGDKGFCIWWLAFETG